MKIAIFSINPIFPEVVTGGASKHLFHIARHLGERGHSVSIYCARAENSGDAFLWAANVMVFPVLPFHLPFPQPYAVSGPDLSYITARLSAGLGQADRFYIHDGEWLLPDTYADIPTVSSFRDNIYPESVLGTFITKADEIICVSRYSQQVIEHTAGRFFPGLKDRIHHVNNGIDFAQFSPCDPAPLARELGLDQSRETILLHPHRPEPGKGLSETVRLAGRLVHQEGYSNLRVLVPEWIGGMASEGETTFHRQMLQLMQDLGVREHFMFIPWLPNERMPELYSLGAVTLCLGQIVEAFGNVAYESLACGTPSIVARIGVHRTLLPDDYITKVHPGDTAAAADRVLEYLRKGTEVHAEVTKFLHEEMDFQRQITQYGQIIEQCGKRPHLRFLAPEGSDSQPYILAPWCYFYGGMVYHDFRGLFEPAEELQQMMEHTGTISKKEALSSGLSENQWETWLERTFIVPQSP